METGNIIKALRESRGLTQQQLAEIVGAKTYTTITKWESGENFPKGRDIRKLSEYFKVSSDYILGLDESNIPKINEYPYFPVSISAGLPLEVNGITDKSVETITIPDSIMGKWAGQSDIYIMKVNGESMNKVIPHESLIAVKSIELSNLKDGDIVVYSDNHDYSVKRFYDDKKNERIIFSPDSTDRSFTDYVIPYTETSNLKIHGKVILYIVELD
ncbi:XRE family transcriptional regulator [Pueribacillus theae]|uniref:XRE family transcriptional regulator n=1 Tax=Pueribacillus theae TaxID=2171751 RepID=A0A2U1JU02_9BACI|nr:XRE family transcriptional regulator [Pueribacillus theae]PWA08622.1 XRE family transcriptional regulator [Pueribacillus theae]